MYVGLRLPSVAAWSSGIPRTERGRFSVEAWQAWPAVHQHVLPDGRLMAPAAASCLSRRVRATWACSRAL